ncbi:FACT complex subunit POB3 [Nosema granulosis]|uniref:FACT complex subunit POB3 n=1 Tax=Nosema granulosis TaxID=83296 RepID=A0A9P6H086_9MICR|nr:FACT complex subunit POB3 [Nosema granulosis]
MEVLTIDKCLLRKDREEKHITMKFAKEGIAIKASDDNITVIKADAIKNIELFRGVRAVCLRIFSDITYFINNIHENHIDDLKKICSEWYKINIYMKEVEIDNVNFGELEISNNAFVEFRNDKTIFDVPVSSIDSIADIRNEISLRFDNVEVRFITDKTSINEIKDLCNNTIEDDIFTIDEVAVVNPRGKNNVKLYKDYFRIVGYSYDHKIYYKGILNIYELNKTYLEDVDKYLVLELDQPIRQGQTKYPLVVFSFADEEIDIEVSDERLEKSYSGLLSEVFVSLLEALCVKSRNTSNFLTADKMRCMKCILKANEGQLYPLDSCLIFLPRALKIKTNEIHSVEFSRINISSMQAKTFDMTIFADAQHVFYGLNKEDFGILEKYFSEKNIAIRSEVIDEVISSDESEGDDSEDFIVSDDE